MSTDYTPQEDHRVVVTEDGKQKHGRIEKVDDFPTSLSGKDLYFVRSDDGVGLWVERDAIRPDQTDAAAYVGVEAKSRLNDLRTLSDCVDAVPQYDRDALVGLGVETDPADDPEAAREEAENRLYEYPLAVEATTTFEIVLGVGGPDSRLLIECSRSEHESDALMPGYDYEIRRVLFRYSWEDTAEIELIGDNKETAEAYARRVVPELVE